MSQVSSIKRNRILDFRKIIKIYFLGLSLGTSLVLNFLKNRLF